MWFDGRKAAHKVLWTLVLGRPEWNEEDLESWVKETQSTPKKMSLTYADGGAQNVQWTFVLRRPKRSVDLGP